ncbi:hypothetical protein M422DRAFT_63797 [Sphaerobolus stellatus SS14]|nr:hypothetical protein M422DRAFT_63797 [Sphaerobolus stellatus SS14]
MLLRPTARRLGLVPRHIRFVSQLSEEKGGNVRDFIQDDARSAYTGTIYVRPWGGIPTMAHLFSIIRELERKYGKIGVFRAPRSSDVRSEYAVHIYATFADLESAKKIPPEGAILRVEVPQTQTDRNENIGLEDLQDLIDPVLRQALLEGETQDTPMPNLSQGGLDGEPSPETLEDRFIDIKIEHTTFNPQYIFWRRPPRVPHGIGSRILAFGGFAEPPFNPQDKPKTAMQRVLADWWESLPEEERDEYLTTTFEENLASTSAATEFGSWEEGVLQPQQTSEASSSFPTNPSPSEAIPGAIPEEPVVEEEEYVEDPTPAPWLLSKTSVPPKRKTKRVVPAEEAPEAPIVGKNISASMERIRLQALLAGKEAAKQAALAKKAAATKQLSVSRQDLRSPEAGEARAAPAKQPPASGNDIGALRADEAQAPLSKQSLTSGKGASSSVKAQTGVKTTIKGELSPPKEQSGDSLSGAKNWWKKLTGL